MLGALREYFTGCDRLNMFEDFGAIIAIGARITDSNQNVLQDDKTGSVFESFPLNALLLNRSFAILTPIAKVFFHSAGCVSTNLCLA